MSRRRVSYIEQTNPLRGLSPARVVAVLEASQRGELAELMWLYHIIEQSDPDLLALVERRSAAVCEMDWSIGVAQGAQTEDGSADVLRAAYDRIENLQEAIAHLALASFRGFSICQLQDADGAPAAPGAATRIACLPHWCFVRDGLSGPFKWNPEARRAGFDGVPGEALDPERDRLLIRTVGRPIDRVALVKFVRANFAQKAWADYIEKVAQDGVFVIEPPNVDETKRGEFASSARDAAEGGGGTLPHGSSIEFANVSRGLAPYDSYMRFLREQLVMAGTGGLLTMISEPTGIGGGATGAHAEAFKTIARKEAREISEVFQRYFDTPLLRAVFPGERPRAYFTIAYREETDVGALIDQAVKLATVFDLDPAEWSEKTGFALSRRAAPAQPPAFAFNARGPEMTEDGKRKTEKELARANDALVSQAVERTLGLREGLLREFFADLDAQPETLTEAQFLDRLEALVDTLPEVVGDRGLTDAQAIFKGVMGAGLANQIAARTEKGKRKTQEPESENRWVTIKGRAVQIDEDGDTENPHSPQQQAAEIGKGIAAMRRAIAQKSDEMNAVTRGDIGPVHFYYDWPGHPPKFKTGSGVAKIIAKYGEETALKIPETIVRGKLGAPYEADRKRDIHWGKYKAILRLDRSGAKETWLLNGFDVREE